MGPAVTVTCDRPISYLIETPPKEILAGNGFFCSGKLPRISERVSRRIPPNHRRFYFFPSLFFLIYP